MNLKKFFIGIFVVSFLIGCQKKPSSDNSNSNIQEHKIVVVDLYPIEFLATKISQGKIQIVNVIKYGIEPHDFELSINDRKVIEDSSGFIRVGAGIDNWSEKLTHNNILDLSKSVSLIKNGDKIDPHYWSDFDNLQKMTSSIAEFLSKEDPKNKNFYIENANKLNQEIINIDNEYKKTLQNCKNKKIVVTHQAYSYLTKRYNIESLSILGIEPEEEPSLMKLKEIKEKMLREGLKVLFLEKIVSSKVPSIIAKETGAIVKPLYSLENLDSDDIKNSVDLFGMSKENLKNIKEALECK
jgi:zinc transport system substrate-binding protein